MTRPAAAVLLPGFLGTTLPSWLEARLRAGLAGVCLFGDNVVSRDQLRALTAAITAANPDALIAIDEEGGDVSRLYQSTGSPFPGNALLGRIDDADYTASVATAVALELRDAGVNLNFAPDVDINSNPDNPVIGVRSFGDDASLVARHSAAWVAAHEAAGVAVSAKHFPGHGDTAHDSHLALPVVDLPIAALRDRELLPFAAAIEAGASTIMTSHIMLPQLDALHPATFSSAILGDLLRNELGFTGVVVTDALDMVGASGEIGIPAAAVRAIAAGCDLLCIGTDNSDAQLDEIERAIAVPARRRPAGGRGGAERRARSAVGASRRAVARALRSLGVRPRGIRLRADLQSRPGHRRVRREPRRLGGARAHRRRPRDRREHRGGRLAVGSAGGCPNRRGREPAAGERATRARRQGQPPPRVGALARRRREGCLRGGPRRRHGLAPPRSSLR
jgi:beta-glucosidase-like glycosyl hydrolase